LQLPHRRTDAVALPESALAATPADLDADVAAALPPAGSTAQ
jgi:hypothetical protein